MSASNKLIFSLEQNLDIDEKNQARKNIGAVAAISQSIQSENITLTNDQAQAGHIVVPLTHHNLGAYLLNVELYAATGSNISDQRVPIRLELRYNGGSSSSVMWTSALEKFNNSAPWYAGLSILDNSGINPLTSLELIVKWEPWKIQTGVTIGLTVEYILLSETEPS